jgi:hypothetical protein
MNHNRGWVFMLTMVSCFVFSASCGNDKPVSNAGAVVDTQHVTEEKIPSDFYKRMEGTIAGQAVIMHLHCYNGTIDGTYYYIKHGESIALVGQVDSVHPGDMVLMEMNEEGAKMAKLDCSYKNGQLKGTWESADKSKNYLIELKEAYPAGSYQFSTANIEDEVRAIPNDTSSPTATITKNILIPVKNAAAEHSWLSGQIVKMISDDTLHKTYDVVAAAKYSNTSFIKSYKEDIEDNAEMASSATANYEDYLHLSVLYNENGFVTIDKNFFSYTGGAHGFGGDLYYCMDVVNKKLLKLSDVLTSDSAQLQLVVEAAFRKARGLSAKDSLNEILFENHLATTSNFYFTSTGIGFLYLPYEVASYAEGSFFVFVPYSDLKKYIRPSFAKRIQLQ